MFGPKQLLPFAQILLVLAGMGPAHAAPPRISYASYIGGSGSEGGGKVAADAAGNYYVAVTTNSSSFNGLQQRLVGGTDIVVLKFSPTNVPLYSIVLGGTGNERVGNAAVDLDGNLFLTFDTSSDDFPKPPGSIVGAEAGAGVLKLSPAGTLLAVALFRDRVPTGSSVYALALDGNKDVWIGGETTGFIGQTGDLQAGPAGLNDGFVARLNNSLTKVSYFTYLGTPDNTASTERVSAIVVDAAGNAYISGIAGTANFPTGPSTPFSKSGCFLMKLDPNNNKIVFASYLTGSGSAWGLALARDSVWVTTNSDANFVPTSDAAQKTRGSLVLMQLSASDGQVRYATYFGGSRNDQIFSLKLSTAGKLVAFGNTNSSDFPVTADAAQRTTSQIASAFIAAFDGGGRPVYASYIGGTTGFGIGVSVALDPLGNAIGAGTTTTTNFPTSAGSLQPLPGGGVDVFLARVDFGSVPDPGGTNPSLSLDAIQNGASFRGGAIAPGEVITIYPKNAGPDSLVGAALTPDRRIATLIGGTRVLFDDVPAPLVYTIKGQISLVVPYSVQGKASSRIVVEYNGVKSTPLEVPVTATAPGIFTLASGTGPAALINENGSVNSAQQPADRGSIIVFFATGEGQTSPAGVDGRLNEFTRIEDYPRPLQTPGVTIGGQPAEILYAGGAPSFLAGLMQFNVRVPQNLQPGTSVPLAITIGSAASQSGVTLSVR